MAMRTRLTSLHSFKVSVSPADARGRSNSSMSSEKQTRAAFGLHIHDYPPIGAANFCYVIQQEPRLLGMALFKLLPEYSATFFLPKKKNSRINKGFIATISPRNGIAMVRNWKR
ncbi:hypothetical protein J1N35_012297 [Gossypium stocksii]|uniref:Uncharacterized protein n=1 Tax=Gossypium stocksii TaxID=47602 RepID=A0A9D3W3W1_9ROSI|nr:hypothetical protein J1N35_012297 [Gossypium stocksii]